MGNVPARFLEPGLAGTAFKLSRPFAASRGFGMSTDADLPLRAIPRAETVGGAIVLAILRWKSCESSLRRYESAGTTGVRRVAEGVELLI